MRTPSIAPTSPRRRFAAVDRDGTILVERHYLAEPDGVELLPGAAEGLRRLSAMGLGVVVVTNQSGVGRGYFDLAALDAIHARMLALLSEQGVQIDGIYFCPHTPDDGCQCRKPQVGMLTRAAAEHGFDPADCFVVGDNACDVELGGRTGAATILVRTGYGARLERDCHPAAATAGAVVNDLNEAATVIGRWLGAAPAAITRESHAVSRM